MRENSDSELAGSAAAQGFGLTFEKHVMTSRRPFCELGALVAVISVLSTAACLKNAKPRVSPLLQAAVSQKSEPLWLYVQANDRIRPQTLKQIASITTPFQQVAPGDVTLEKFVNKFYGINSKTIRELVQVENPQLDLKDRVRGPVNLVGAPVFSQRLQIDTFQTQYQTAIYGDAYLRIRPQFASNTPRLENELSRLKKDDPDFDFWLGKGLYVVPSWTTCPADATRSTTSEAYASLEGWKPNQPLKEAPVLIAIVDTGVTLAPDRIEPTDVASIVREDFDKRLPLWENDSPTTDIRQSAMAHDPPCVWDKFGCDSAQEQPSGAVEDVSADRDDFGHGTHVAGIAAGLSGSGIPNNLFATTLPIEIMPIKVRDESGHINPRSFQYALAYAKANGARVVNISENGFSFPGFEDEIDYPRIVVVVAAGNGLPGKDGTEILPNSMNSQYPAWLSYKPNVITVAAVDSYGRFAPMSNWSTRFATIAAPGYLKSLKPFGEMELRCGTSQAAPVVALTVALMLTRRTLKPPDVKNILQLSSDYEPTLTSRVAFAGRLNMKRALSLDQDLIEMRSGNEPNSPVHLHRGEIASGPKQISIAQSKQGSNAATSKTIDWTHVARIDLGLGKDKTKDKGEDRILSWGCDEQGYKYLVEDWGVVGGFDSITITGTGSVARDKIVTLITRYPRAIACQDYSVPNRP